MTPNLSRQFLKDQTYDDNHEGDPTTSIDYEYELQNYFEVFQQVLTLP